MLVKPHKLFADALERGYAIGAFNTSNLELTQAIVAAAAEQRSPVIVQTSEKAIAYAGLKTLVSLVRTLADETAVPVVLHLDHGKSLSQVQACVTAGYTSVMIDTSTRPLAENVRLTKEAVEYAHDRGVWVEAELGAILGQEGQVRLGGGPTPAAMMTDPGQAAQFVRETGVDALAVSVGTIHGAFTGQEYIRFELLQAIQVAVPLVPLVIHGASGIADEHLKRAAQMQVAKINVDTELRLAFDRAIRTVLTEQRTAVDPREVLGSARAAVQETVAAKIRLFGSAGRVRLD